jgi:hypothetical protein
MHVNGFSTSFYWATFPYEYVNTIRNKGLHYLRSNQTIQIHHSKPCNLAKLAERKEFVKEFSAMVKYVFQGAATVGHVRPGGDAILGPIPEKDNSDMESDSDEIFAEKNDEVAYAFYDDLQQVDLSDLSEEDMIVEEEDRMWEDGESMRDD